MAKAAAERERVLVLGATSAIAAEAILLHAARGDRLHLVARSAEKLAALRSRIRGGDVTQAIADLSRLEACEQIVRDALAALGTVDRVLIAHGLLGDQLATEQSFAEAETVLRTNFLSGVALLIPLANQMEKAGHGRIAVITSVAGERGRPRNYTYGTAKGALNLYLQGLRSRLYKSGVRITTIKLGPVDTPMTAAHRKNALFGEPEKVARAIVQAVDRGRAEVYVPGFWALIMFAVRNTPEWIFQKLSFLSGR